MKHLSILCVLLLVWLIVGLGSAWAGSLSATLAWSNPVDVTDSIQIEKGASLAGPFTVLSTQVAGTVTSTDATNAPGQTVCYRVAYMNTSGIGPYAGPVCKTFPALPTQAPGALTVQ